MGASWLSGLTGRFVIVPVPCEGTVLPGRGVCSFTMHCRPWRSMRPPSPRSNAPSRAPPDI